MHVFMAHMYIETRRQCHAWNCTYMQWVSPQNVGAGNLT